MAQGRWRTCREVSRDSFWGECYYQSRSMRSLRGCVEREPENRTRQTMADQHSTRYSSEKDAHTLHEFLQPPPLSSVLLGGFHIHVHSNDTDGLPPVE